MLNYMYIHSHTSHLNTKYVHWYSYSHTDDWRLAPSLLEERDSFFSTLKLKIEVSVRRHKRPAIMMAHSMGNLVFLYFIDWLRDVDKPPGGHERWLDKHIWSFVGFAAPLLGSQMIL
jgi:phospholipid:diacylglycerol acyltransferase